MYGTVFSFHYSLISFIFTCKCGWSVIRTPSNRPKRRDLSVHEKIEIFRNFDELPSMTQCEAAGLLGISSSTLCKLFKNRNDFKHDFFTNENSNRKRKGCGKDGEMKATLKDWFTHVREKDARLNGPCLREKAEQLARKMGKPEFKATEGWCNRWIKRENIVFKTPKGKAGDADVSAVHSWLKEQWPILISEYSPSDVYNADESGLYYRALPKASYVFKNENARGCKIAKDGITILCCVSMTDEKENLLVMDKSAAVSYTHLTLPTIYSV